MKKLRILLGLFLIGLIKSNVHAFVPLPEWTTYYVGTANLDDVANAVAVDSTSVYVTGYEMTSSSPIIVSRGWVQKYNSSGTLIWTSTFGVANSRNEGKAIIASTSTSNVYIAGLQNKQAVLKNYDKNGILQWSVVNASFTESIWNGVAVGTDSVYVTGYAVSTGSDIEVVLSKYDTSGLLIWTTYYNRFSSQDIGQAVITVGNNVYVCGGSQKKSWLGKFDKNGRLLNSKYFGGDGVNTDSCLGLATDSSFAVYMAGYLEKTKPQRQFGYVQKIGDDGLLRWTTTYGGAKLIDGGQDRAKSIVVASSNVFVGGTLTNAITKQDISLTLYDTNGLLQWTTTYNQFTDTNTLESGRDFATGVTISSGSFYVVGGVSKSTSTIYDTQPSSTTIKGTDGIIRKY